MLLWLFMIVHITQLSASCQATVLMHGHFDQTYESSTFPLKCWAIFQSIHNLLWFCHLNMIANWWVTTIQFLSLMSLLQSQLLLDIDGYWNPHMFIIQRGNKLLSYFTTICTLIYIYVHDTSFQAIFLINCQVLVHTCICAQTYL